MQSLPTCSRSGVDKDQVLRFLEKEFRMIRVTVDVVSDAARSMVTVQAESIRQAVEIAKEHSPSCDARVALPIDPEAFFRREPGRSDGGVDRGRTGGVSQANEIPAHRISAYERLRHYRGHDGAASIVTDRDLEGGQSSLVEWYRRAAGLVLCRIEV
jgi:hypothetical protein